ncbi:tripartite tricarboxylate transporter substrate binding protein [Caldibacillus debilis]|uniref:Tripartite-type tricarboxylate transporter, receptor component TctC n=1 Tax=Caldibacillus debilis GB1 TaxID=1339248 RepID=A0A420VGC2_9BACI|nr:tripartite tricarboxylate transporter substrate binding protein [Caldibacillus debilis]RKO62606.1 hypothetical protein Cdeb_03146 [Caldibacillus debilis GB1]
MKKFITCLLALFLMAGLAACASSAAITSEPEKKGGRYPERQIELVVPFAAGGGVDLVARAVAEYLSKEWGKPVIVANKTGGGGIVGARYALSEAKPDGYTALMNNNSSTTMYEAGTNRPVLRLKDHMLAARVAESPLVYAVRADAPWKDLRELTEWVKENPENLSWASVGPAGFSSFGVAEWLSAAGIDYKKTRMVSSEGASDSAAKVAGGHVLLAVHNAGEVYSLVQAGKLKVLAVQDGKRSPLYPDVPTTEELGFHGLTVKWWTGISLPAGTPEAIVKKWEAAVAKMEKDKGFIGQLEKIYLQPSYLPSAEFKRSAERELDWYAELAEEMGIRK